MSKRLLNGLLAVLPLAGLPAQDARADLQRAIVIDEQEHDLGKAEAMYQKLYEHGALGDAERAEVALRLGKVLQRLGKTEQATAMLQRAVKAGGEVGEAAQQALAAQGQDGEREKQLRAQARELVGKLLGGSVSTRAVQYVNTGIWGIGDAQVAQNLLWLGDAAVPEIISALEPVVTAWGQQKVAVDVSNPAFGKGVVARGLLGLLWKYGGKQAQQFLASIANNDSVGLRIACVEAAAYLEPSDMLPTLYLFLRDRAAGAPVQTALLLGDSGEVRNRIPTTELLAAAKAGSNAVKSVVLRYLAQYWQKANHAESKPATTEQALPLMREALASTDPELGRSGQQFLFSKAMLESPGGIELLLREYPKLSASDQIPGALPDVKAEDAMHLLPIVLEAARALGPVSERDANKVPRRQLWLGGAAQQVVAEASSAALPQVLELIDLGYDVAARGSLAVWLYGPENGPCRFGAEQSEQVLARYDRVYLRRSLLGALAKLDLPARLWPLLRDKAEANKGSEEFQYFLRPIGKTGVPEAADWLLQQASLSTDLANAAAAALLELGRRSQAEPVRVATRTLLFAAGKVADSLRMQLFLALASMGDTGVFARTDDAAAMTSLLGSSAHHPYGSQDRPVMLLAYLLQEHGDPPCGYSTPQVIEAIRSIARTDGAFFTRLDPRSLTIAAIPDLVLGEIGRQVLVGDEASGVKGAFERNVSAWLKYITRRIAADSAAGAADLRAWAERCLADKNFTIRYGVLRYLEDDVVPQLRAAIEARMGDDDERCAVVAARLLLRAGIAGDRQWLQRLLQSPFADVRELAVAQLAPGLGDAVEKLVIPSVTDKDAGVRLAACKYLGAIVSKDAVPELLARLKDDKEDVRTAAAEALQKIRFYHEQQAHWDRILHGVDASITNATEKLLAQAHPDQPKPQRLLAIQSLADLSAPEALPFLIDWMGEKDADIAAAARSAITAIHQRAGAK